MVVVVVVTIVAVKLSSYRVGGVRTCTGAGEDVPYECRWHSGEEEEVRSKVDRDLGSVRTRLPLLSAPSSWSRAVRRRRMEA